VVLPVRSAGAAHPGPRPCCGRDQRRRLVIPGQRRGSRTALRGRTSRQRCGVPELRTGSLAGVDTDQTRSRRVAAAAYWIFPQVLGLVLLVGRTATPVLGGPGRTCRPRRAAAPSATLPSLDFPGHAPALASPPHASPTDLPQPARTPTDRRRAHRLVVRMARSSNAPSPGCCGSSASGCATTAPNAPPDRYSPPLAPRSISADSSKPSF